MGMSDASEMAVGVRTRLVSPRQQPLPASHELERGVGRAQYLGVTYRQDREGTRPWVARYLDRTVGNYKTALEAAVARWICSRYDCDVIEDDGTWFGQAYQGKEEGKLVITRFTGASEDDVMRQLEEHLYGKNTDIVHSQDVEDETPDKCSSVVPSPPLANPRRDATLPTELPRTSGRGQYRGVVESKGRYMARWNNKLHLGTYSTAIEAGLAVYIAEHYDRDIEADGHGGFKGRAYRKSATGQPSVQHFRASTEAELTRLIDESNGILGRAETSEVQSATVLGLDEAIRRFWHDVLLKYSQHDGRAVCTELYRMWQLFLSREGLPHLVRVKEKDWCCAVEQVLGLQRFNLPYEPLEQALLVPATCRLPFKQPKQGAVWRLQWNIVMTETCMPDVCVSVWIRRREASKHRDIVFRQQVIEDEIDERRFAQAALA